MNGKGRRATFRICSFVLWACLLSLGTVAAASVDGVPYSLTGAIPGPDGPWDYMSIDPVTDRLYMSHNGAATLDLASRKWERTLDLGAMVSAVLPLRSLNRMIFSERSTRSVVIANLSTHQIIARVRTGIGTDGMTYDPKTGLAVVMAGEGDGFASLVNIAQLRAVARVRVGGDLEFPASNGDGIVYINVSSQGEIAVLDLKQRRVVARFPIKGCRDSTGLAYDGAAHLLISACERMAAIMSARGKHLRLVKEIQIGVGADAVFVDPKTRLAFIPCGGSGTLAIIALRHPAHPRLVQVLKTQKGARTGTVDPGTGKVYLAVARLGPVPPGGHWPSAVPGTFRILMFKPSK